jgi:hypothetical protein
MEAHAQDGLFRRAEFENFGPCRNMPEADGVVVAMTN